METDQKNLLALVVLLFFLALVGSPAEGAEQWEQEHPTHDVAHVAIGAGWQWVCTQKLEQHPAVCFVGLMAGVALKEYVIDDNPNFLGRDGAGYAAGAGAVELFKWRF